MKDCDSVSKIEDNQADISNPGEGSLETGQFSLIAGNVPVADKGIVTYKNNTLSEYIITIQPIPEALISDMNDMQETRDGKPFMIIVAAIYVLLLGLSLILWIQWKKGSNIVDLMLWETESYLINEYLQQRGGTSKGGHIRLSKEFANA